MYRKQMQQMMKAVVTIQCCTRAVAKKIGISENEMVFLYTLAD